MLWATGTYLMEVHVVVMECFVIIASNSSKAHSPGVKREIKSLNLDSILAVEMLAVMICLGRYVIIGAPKKCSIQL